MAAATSHLNPRFEEFTALTAKQTGGGGASGDWLAAAQEITELGSRGSISKVLLRLAAVASVTTCIIKVWYGEDVSTGSGSGDGYTSATDPATVPDERVVYESGTITLAGSATVASHNENVLLDKAGAQFYLRDSYEGKLWFSIQVTGGTGDATVDMVRFEAVD